MNRRMLIIPFMVLGSWMCVAGCGGGDETVVVSKAEFLARGNVFCKEALEKQSEAFQRLVNESVKSESSDATKSDRKRLKPFMETVSGTVRTMIAEFEELGAPPAQEEAVTAMLEEYDQGAKKAEEKPKAFTWGKVFIRADDRAEALGLVKCSDM